jgi:hypothetical protein
MATLLERNQAIAARIARPDGLNEQLRQLFLRGKRDQLVHGLDIHGSPFVPLAASTLRYHQGSTTPLAPLGEASQIVTRYEVTVTTANTEIQVHAGWPGLDWVQYHVTGGRHLPRRDPSGFRDQDKTEAMRLFREWVMDER